MKILNFIKSRLKKYINEETWLSDYVKMGLKLGNDCHIQPGLVIDHSNCWLIEIGNNVTIAPFVYLLAHDASTKMHLNCTKVGRVVIEDNCFIGARAIIMPGVTIGKNAIVAAGSIVTKNVEPNSVVGGNPAKFICTLDDYLAKQKELMSTLPNFDNSYSINHNISTDKKIEMNQKLKNQMGFRF
jgi:maltose O-acetyltransferase